MQTRAAIIMALAPISNYRTYSSHEICREPATKVCYQTRSQLLVHRVNNFCGHIRTKLRHQLGC